MATKEEISKRLEAENAQRNVPSLINNIAGAMAEQNTRLATLDELTAKISEALDKLTRM